MTTTRHKIFILTIFGTILWSCKNDDRKFPEAKKLSEYEKTEFLTTLENKISKDKNAVYCVTLLYAWNEIRESIKTPLLINKQLHDLTLLNSTKSHIDVLNANEYSVNSEVNGESITAKAEFNKSLPFDVKLTSFNDELTFGKTKVSSFGTFGYDYQTSEIVKILFYKDDNNFIISLLPNDKQHEIVLFKSEKQFETMTKMLTEINKNIELGKNEKQNEKLSWKYFISDYDEVVIPKFNFNIETNYTTIEGNKFQSNKKNYQIETAWQRTAFILDESGAEIESEAAVEASTEESEETVEMPKPQKLRFDKPFFLMLKKTDNKNPYFGLWVANSELMVKE